MGPLEEFAGLSLLGFSIADGHKGEGSQGMAGEGDIGEDAAPLLK